MAVRAAAVTGCAR